VRPYCGIHVQLPIGWGYLAVFLASSPAAAPDAAKAVADFLNQRPFSFVFSLFAEKSQLVRPRRLRLVRGL
ncbi:MAG: hypothetical protein RSC06_02655, partial [Clostridia bacterium]